MEETGKLEDREKFTKMDRTDYHTVRSSGDNDNLALAVDLTL